MRPPLCLALLAMCPAAFGWGTEGHALVARIADAQLTPKAKAQVAAILGSGSTIVSVASWADEIRRSRADTGPWHYVDIPNEKDHLDMTRDCANGNCVVSAIAHFREVLRNPATAPDQRREALMFLIHFIGDMHQPLHSTERNNDHGGNTVQVQFHDRRTNLHSLWDSGLLGRMPPEDQLLTGLAAESHKKRKKWRKGTATQWAEESHKQAQKVVYGMLPAGPPETAVTIDDRYETAAGPVVREQIERAGARLAAVLNADLK